MPCDVSGMIDIHRTFKAGFGGAATLVTGVREGDAAHADIVAAHIHALSAGLHSHHEYEDGHFWEPVTQRLPSCALHVERMKEQHAAMLVFLNALDAALPAWRASGTHADAEPVLQALVGINRCLAEHLPDEEKNVVPALEEVMTQKEVDAAGQHGRRAVPKGQAFPFLGAILAAQPDGGETWLRTHMPLPGRLAWRLIGKKQYLANRHALERGPG
ncbi:hemerythrin domain-containing protein [Pseudactinotalea terrae]|uniref:hemerythrin domain-containing protein n=1 Tax=Pseudactinotalea terrae TaxID=1743262 RepID=UPI0012E24FF7|nr:hemerythrin domain-containing protein [Pseudactinotalea terrae]